MGASFSSFFSSYGHHHHYDVYISFRGEDTRYSFTRHLYRALCIKGIRTFCDGMDIKQGEDIKSSFFKAIENSRIAVVVLSPSYANSAYCLDELVKIMDCFQAKGQLVLPVYYMVNPSDVRNQRGSYGKAMAEHEERFKDDDMEKVKKWREALRQVGNLHGYAIKHWNDHDHYMAIKKIVEAASTMVHVRRYTGIASTVVGLVCYALSSSFNRLYGQWTSWKISVYTVFSLILCLAISFPDAWRHWRIFRYNAHIAFLILISTTLYSYYSDKNLKEKPDAYGVVSSAAFAMMSLCMTKKFACGFSDLMYYFCAVMITQLVDIEPLLDLVGVALSYFLIMLRSYLDDGPVRTRDKRRREEDSDLKEVLIA